MNIPDWAPPILVHLYNNYSYLMGNRAIAFESEQHITELLKEDEKFNPENHRLRFHETEFGIPEEEGKKLLHKLLTNLSMKAVWASIDSRAKNKSEFREFWLACVAAISGWRNDRKKTPRQERDLFLKIRQHASELFKMMNETAEFQGYSNIDLIDSDSLEPLLQSLHDQVKDIEGQENIEYLTRYILADGGPSIYQELEDIAAKALRYAEEPPIVLKPNSHKASIHYFVRTLSRYLRAKYDQPLHEVVAGTAGVVFDDPDINSDYVRKLVK